MLRHVGLAVGDTAGHVLPALALAETYAREAAPVQVHFFTAGEGTGHWLIERSTFPLSVVPGSPFAGEGRVRQVAALARIVAAIGQARRALVEKNIRLVVGTGGYGSVATLVAARSLGLRTAIIEPNVLPGLANRWLARIVHRAYVSYEEARDLMPPGKALVTGIPLRRNTTTVKRQPPEFPRVRLLVVSGSRGAQFFGTEVPALAATLRRHGLALEIRHQAGPHAATTTAAYARLNESASVVGFIDDISSALTWADFVISRAGAGAIADVAIAGLPALFVPWSSAAHDHQTTNAAALVRRGAALSVREDEWNTDAVAGRVLSLLTDRSRWSAMSQAVRTLATRDAAAHIVRDCEELMRGRW